MKATLMIAAAMIAVFAYSVFFVPDIDAFYSQYGFSGANMLARPYVIVTSIFLHAGIEHILSNLLVLLFFGFAAEKELGAPKMLAIFFIGAFAGDLFSLFVYPFDALAVGASAGIFALVGVGMIVRPMDLSLYPLVVPIPLLFLGVLYAIYNIAGFLFLPQSEISYAAHFGGFFIGLAAGFAKKGLKRGLLLLVAGFAVIAAAIAVYFAFIGK